MMWVIVSPRKAHMVLNKRVLCPWELCVLCSRFSSALTCQFNCPQYIQSIFWSSTTAVLVHSQEEWITSTNNLLPARRMPVQWSLTVDMWDVWMMIRSSSCGVCPCFFSFRTSPTNCLHNFPYFYLQTQRGKQGQEEMSLKGMLLFIWIDFFSCVSHICWSWVSFAR